MSKKDIPIIGAHMSTSGGIHNIFANSAKINGNTAQVFTSSPRQWNGRKYTEEEISLYKIEKAKYADFQVFSHASYLINIASPDSSKRQSAIDAFTGELNRCGALTVPYVVLHPGSFTGGTREEGIAGIADSLNYLLEIAKDLNVQILLETTAGQGSYLGSTFEELATIADKTNKGRDRLGFCLDTCHIFVSGIDIRTDEEYEKVWQDFDNILGISNLKLLHLNDTDKDLNSRGDRHQDIGTGKLGLHPFELIVNDERLKNIPKIIETPGDDADHERNIKVLRELYRG